MFGTFELTLEDATPRSPYPDGTTANLTIAIDGTLCAPGLRIEQPFMRGGDPNTLYWSDTNVGLEFALDVSGAFNGMRVGNTNGTYYGTLTGERADATDPCDYHSRFFELAEANYPDLFPESIFVLTRLTPTSFYRYYSPTGIYLGIADDIAFASGGPYRELTVLGDVQRLIAGVDELVIPGSEQGFIPYVAAITGSLVVEIGNFPAIDRNVRRNEAPVPLPAATDTATLSTHMQQLLRNELKGTSTFTFRNVVSTNASLSFEVDIRNTARVGSTETSRLYRLRVVYTKQ
ncbi:MAG: hypothetical protein SV422_09275, partial [Pseudomonadota bacterium]|nr:hypothetical protein [Pseudomonadota bacterium]